MNIVNYYREAISDIILDEFSLKNDDIKNISFEFPKETGLGDFSTNAAMALAGKLKKTPLNKKADSLSRIGLYTIYFGYLSSSTDCRPGTHFSGSVQLLTELQVTAITAGF